MHHFTETVSGIISKTTARTTELLKNERQKIGHTADNTKIPINDISCGAVYSTPKTGNKKAEDEKITLQNKGQLVIENGKAKLLQNNLSPQIAYIKAAEKAIKIIRLIRKNKQKRK